MAISCKFFSKSKRRLPRRPFGGLLAMTALFDGAVRNVRKRQEPWFLPLRNQYFFFSTKYAPQWSTSRRHTAQLAAMEAVSMPRILKALTDTPAMMTKR